MKLRKPSRAFPRDAPRWDNYQLSGLQGGALLICREEMRLEEPVLFPTVKFANILPKCLCFFLCLCTLKLTLGRSGWAGCQTPQAVVP